MDTSFVDLDILLNRIRHPPSRAYFLDAVKAYKAGALRASLSSTWVAVAYDLIAKYRELSAAGDAAAATFLQSWDQATGIGDVRQLLRLEGSIVEHACVSAQIIDPIARSHLERLKVDRNYCAHPAFSAEAELFEPSAELARLHLVNAVDLVLSREPLQGTAIFAQFESDVQTTGFPTAHSRVLDYVAQRYLTRVRAQNIRNFGTVLAKSLLKGIPAPLDAHRDKIVSSLVAVRDRADASWPDVSTAIVRLIDNLEPQWRPRAIAFIAAFPEFWPRLQPPTQTALQETVDNTDADTLADFRLLAGVTLAQFRTPLLDVIGRLDADALARAISAEALVDLWPRAVELYRGSGSFRGSEANFRELIAPFAGRLGGQQHDSLLDAVIENPQNWDAGATPTLLLALLQNSPPGQAPSHETRDRFFQYIRRMRRADHYDEVFAWFGGDGWVPPVAQPIADDE